ncbi:MAG TPA: hydantoinase B/oxoprolinase family protein, partial [Dehalococcoidia bacterium]|nr:hydantoinase B/oxoprolinase family protein [Dehalococcoidia bacterium]
DLVVLNDPYLGGTHLPDITTVSPVFIEGQLAGFVATRAHHADVGGMSPGSMPLAQELLQEGVIIPPIKLIEAGRLNHAVYDLFLRNVRTPDERRGDFEAQMATHKVGEQRFQEVVQRYGLAGAAQRMAALQDYAQRMTRAAIAAIPDGDYTFEDYLDDDGVTQEEVGIRVTVQVRDDSLHCDFSGSSPQRPSSVNAVAAVTRSAVYYVVRCLLDDSVPSNDGCFRPVTLTLPEGSIVNAQPPLAVSAGNVETSQRVVDALLGALAKALPDRIPAASNGSMNNLSLGGFDTERGQMFAYYETVGGGAGASPEIDGASAIHSHMTNTLNTPVEAIEMAYPLRIRQYALRRDSGGRGQRRGGDGIVRTWEFLAPVTATIITDRRRCAPWGLAGGLPGQPGRNLLSRGGETMELPSKCQLQLQPGDVLTIETPGGGGWGEPSLSSIDNRGQQLE